MSHTMQIHTTIDGADVTVTVGYDYQREEAMTRDYPGCPEQVDIYEVMDGKADITHLLTEKETKRLEQQVLDALHSDDGA